MEKILIIDDNLKFCEMLVETFKGDKMDAVFSLTLEHGIDQLFSDEFGVVLLDVNLPDGNGLDAIESIRKHSCDPEIIIMTGYSDPKGVEFAMKSGVWDYIQKGGSTKEFKFSLARALKYRRQKQPKIKEIPFRNASIVGQSQRITNCLDAVLKASKNDVSVMITGDTGTGKELFAKSIHENSRRRKEDFIIVDCAALPEDLVESMLLGHTKGAFTGADSDKLGLIQLADKGTLFLDEVGELPLILQKKFLRVLQEKKYRPIGSKKEVSSDFRLVVATNRDLAQMVEQGRFRKDFYFRIAATTIELPPLRLRKTDIPFLVTHHMNQKNEGFNKCPGEIAPEFMIDLLEYDWPGNVRELLNAIDHACTDSYQESSLFPKHLPDYIRAFNIKNKIVKSNSPPAMGKIPVDTLKLKDYIEMMKQNYVKELMSHTRGDKKTACRLSGLSMGHLYSLLKNMK
jgi:two-component system, NtrC family, response regulator